MDISKTIKEFNQFVNNAPEGACFSKAKMKKLEACGFVRELSPEEENELLACLKNNKTH